MKLDMFPRLEFPKSTTLLQVREELVRWNPGLTSLEPRATKTIINIFFAIRKSGHRFLQEKNICELVSKYF